MKENKTTGGVPDSHGLGATKKLSSGSVDPNGTAKISAERIDPSDTAEMSSEPADPNETVGMSFTSHGSDETETDDSGRQIDNYRLVKRIAAGGMGEVYDAEQLKPIRRRVALKVIKLGMDTKEFIARFESERQALAMMDHPFIAKVFDAGTTERGRPYLVMEYVQGLPITEHCDSHNMDVRQRLELFSRVCEGIQHAHQKGIIHRDIKPSNVMVTIQDGQAWPKIIDFGVAKALDQKLADLTVYTELGQIVGTPAYMSPEQFEMMGQNIDTRTDIYMLGVLLYELLTGVLPLDMEELQSSGLEGLLRSVREDEPPRPSGRITTLGDLSPTMASNRGATLPKLRSQLKGDLDWITMRAIEKDRNRRYQTVNALILEIKRYLEDEPVRAGPPSTSYRLRKFVKRHRTAVVAASAVFLALILGISGTTIGLFRAIKAEKVASAEAERAYQVSEFLVGLFGVADPSEARGNTITAREILDKGVDRIESELEEQPLTQARLMNTMGRVYKELGLYQEARPLLEKSLATLRDHDSGSDPNTAVVLNDLGGLLRVSGDYEGARRHLEDALAIREHNLGSDHPDVAQSLNSYANLLWQIGEYDQAEQLYSRALIIREKSLGSEHPDVAITLNNLGGLRMQAGDYQGAHIYFERSLAIREKRLGSDHPDVARSLINLGKLHYAMGEFEEARPFYERALAIREKVFGPEHPIVASSLNDFAILLEDAGEYDQAQRQYERALEIREKALGPDHPDVAGSLNNLANFYTRRGDYESTPQLLERALSIWEQARGPNHIDVATGLNTLGIALVNMGEFTRAVPHLERARIIQEENFGTKHPEVARTLNNIGIAQSYMGDYENAQRNYQRSIAIWEETLGPDHPDVAQGLQSLGNLLREMGDLAGASPLLERSLVIQEKTFGPEHPDVATCLSDLALLQYFSGNHVKAQALFERSLAIRRRYLPGDHPELIDNLYNLACLSALKENREQALGFLRDAVDGGFANVVITQDPDLSSLHGDPEFEDMVRKIHARAAGE